MSEWNKEISFSVKYDFLTLWLHSSATEEKFIDRLAKAWSVKKGKTKKNKKTKQKKNNNKKTYMCVMDNISISKLVASLNEIIFTLCNIRTAFKTQHLCKNLLLLLFFFIKGNKVIISIVC